MADPWPLLDRLFGYVPSGQQIESLIPLTSESGVSLEHGTFARASRNFMRGEQVEIIPSIPIPHRARYSAFDHDALYRLVYPVDSQRIRTVAGLGYSAAYAYSKNPNVSVRPFHRNLLVAVALRNIEIGEVITRVQPFNGMPEFDERLPSSSGYWVTQRPYPIKLARRIFGLGVGIRASRRIRQDEVIEVCPVIVVTGKAVPASGKMGLTPFLFDWREIRSRRSSLWHPRAIALGYAGIYNHSDRFANAYVERESVYEGHSGSIVFRALEDIQEGSEIVHNYRHSGVGTR